MDFENAAVALIDNEQKPFVHALFDRLCTLYEDMFARFKKYFNIDMIYFHDDWGGQRSPFFSENTVREMLLPYLKRLARSAHDMGLLFNFHSCGKIENFVPVMIEAGADIWSGQMLNDMRSVLEKHSGQIMLDINPGFAVGVPYTEEEAKAKTEAFLDEYGEYLNSVVFQNFTPYTAPVEMIRAYSGCSG
jgi:uroporphyrinogen-III decarboxylase